MGWTSIYQLFWGSLGTRVLTIPSLVAQRKVGVKIETQHPSNVTWHKLETHWAGAAGGCQDLSILTGTCPDRSATANLVTSSWCCLEQICGWHFSICVLCKIISRPFAHNIYLSIDLSIDLYLSISIYLSLSICLSIYLSLSISIYIYLYLSISIYIYLYLSISIYIYLSISIYLSIYLSLSIYRSIYLSLSIYRLYICIQSGLWSYYYFAQDIARSSKPTTFPMPLSLDSCVIALTYRRHGCPSLTNIET